MKTPFAFLLVALTGALVGGLGVGVGIEASSERQASTAALALTSGVTIRDSADDDAVKDGPARVYRRAPDGLFYVTARVNGVPVRFVVDTGASVTVMARRDAARAGIVADRFNARDEMQTAAGKTGMSWSTVDRIAVAGRRFKAVEAAISDADLPASLLGQDLLLRFGSVTLKRDTLTIA